MVLLAGLVIPIRLHVQLVVHTAQIWFTHTPGYCSTEVSSRWG